MNKGLWTILSTHQPYFGPSVGNLANSTEIKSRIMIQYIFFHIFIALKQLDVYYYLFRYLVL